MKYKIFSSTLAVSAILILLSFFNKGIAFFREVLYAKNFGLGIEFNAYLVSSILPITIYSTIYYLSQLYFVPAYNKIVAGNKHEDKKFLSDNFWIFFYIGCIIAISLFSLSEIIIDFYLANVNIEIKQLSLQIFRVYVFTIPLSAAHSILSAYLNAESKFTYPAISIVILNVTVVAALVLLVDKFGIFVIPFAFILGMLLQLVFLIYHCRKKINFNPLAILHADSFSNVFNTTLFLTLLTEVIVLSFTLIDRYFIDRLGEGGVAALSYSYQVFELPVKIFTFAIATIIFSKFAKSFQSLNRIELERQFQVGIKLAVFIFTPIAIIYMFWGDAIIKMLYERGRFTSSDTELTYSILKFYTISLVIFSIYAIVNKMIYSTGMLKNLLIISTLGAVVKIFLSFLLINKYQQAGLAITTSVAYGVLCISGYIVVVKKLNFIEYIYPIKDLVIYSAIGTVCASVAYFSADLLFLSINEKNIVSLFIFIIIYTLSVLFLDTKEVNWAQELVRESFSKKNKNSN
jgi:putative peptidoglycan lipid II flippase